MPNTERIEDIIDIAKVEGQVQKTLELVEKVSAAIKNVKPMADMFKDSSGIANTKKSYDDLAKATQTVNQHQTELSLSIKEYQKLQDQIAQQAAKINALESDAAKTLAARREEQRQLNQEIKNSAIVNAAAEGSIQKMRAELNLLTQAYDKMSQAQRNSTQGQTLKTQIEGQVNALKTLEAETGRFQRNVGNYTGAISILERSLTEIKQKMDDLTKSGQGNSTEVEKLQKEHDLLNQILNRQTQGFTSLTMEVRANEKALATMFAEGMQNTDAFQQLQTQVANAKRETKRIPGYHNSSFPPLHLGSTLRWCCKRTCRCIRGRCRRSSIICRW
jgi:chromosome segregation ATPase